MATANLGIAMGAAGSDAAIEASDIALMSDDLEKLAWLVKHSRDTLMIIKQNVVFSLAIKAVFTGLIFADLTTLWLSMLADIGATFIVVTNSLRLVQRRHVSTKQIQAAKRMQIEKMSTAQSILSSHSIPHDHKHCDIEAGSPGHSSCEEKHSHSHTTCGDKPHSHGSCGDKPHSHGEKPHSHGACGDKPHSHSHDEKKPHSHSHAHGSCGGKPHSHSHGEKPHSHGEKPHAHGGCGDKPHTHPHPKPKAKTQCCSHKH